MNKNFLKLAAGVAGFFITIGLVIPWLISNDTLPMPFIVVGVVCVSLVWLSLVEKPALRLIRWMNDKFKELDR